MRNALPARNDRRIFIVAVCLIIATATVTQAANYTISVNANKKTQQWNRFYEQSVSTCHVYTVLNSYWGRGIAGQMKVANKECGFKMFRGHGILDDDVGLVVSASSSSLVLNWTRFDSIYDAGKAANMWPMFEVGFTPTALASGTNILGLWYNGKSPNMSPPTKYGWGKWMDLMDSIVRHVENRYGADTVRQKWYFEVWNEASWMYSLGEAGYQELYDYTVTGLLRADPNIKVGGPAYSAPSSVNGIPSLINHCLTGTNAATGSKGTKLDFVTYHKYGTDDVGGCPFSAANATSMNCFHKYMVDKVKAISAFKGELINNEWGPNSQIMKYRDLECAASFVAKTIHLLNENGTAYPPPVHYGYWALSDIYEENQNNTNRYTFAEATQGMFLRGDPTIPDSWEIGKPAFNAFRMMHKLGAWEVSCTGGTTGDGVNALATVSGSNDSLQILVYNHFNGGEANPQTVDNVALSVDSIPFAPGQVRVEHWVVDYSHSNSFRPWESMGKPAKPTAAQWATLKQAATLMYYDSITTSTLTGKLWTKSFTQNYNSVGLIVLAKAGVVSAIPSSPHVRVAAIDVKVTGKDLLITISLNGNYLLRLYSFNGKEVLNVKAVGPGKNIMPLERIPAGVYILRCVSRMKTMEIPVYVGQ